MQRLIVREGKILKQSIDKEWKEFSPMIEDNDWVYESGYWFYSYRYEMDWVKDPPANLKLLTMIME